MTAIQHKEHNVYTAKGENKTFHIIRYLFILKLYYVIYLGSCTVCVCVCAFEDGEEKTSEMKI